MQAFLSAWNAFLSFFCPINPNSSCRVSAQRSSALWSLLDRFPISTSWENLITSSSYTAAPCKYLVPPKAEGERGQEFLSVMKCLQIRLFFFFFFLKQHIYNNTFIILHFCRSEIHSLAHGLLSLSSKHGVVSSQIRLTVLCPKEVRFIASKQHWERNDHPQLTSSTPSLALIIVNNATVLEEV